MASSWQDGDEEPCEDDSKPAHEGERIEAEFGESEWGAFRLWLTDPRYTTLGLQALLALLPLALLPRDVSDLLQFNQLGVVTPAAPGHRRVLSALYHRCPPELHPVVVHGRHRRP